jgi:hypothetical protein
MALDLFSDLPPALYARVATTLGRLAQRDAAQRDLDALMARRPRDAASAARQRAQLRAAEIEITALTTVLDLPTGAVEDPSVLEDRGLFTGLNRREAGLGAG